MKVLTVTQPYATLIAIEAKLIETRSWSTSYRGQLGIHAAKGLGGVGGNEGYSKILLSEPFRSVLLEYMRNDDSTFPCFSDEDVKQLLPRGAIIAVAELVDIQPTIKVQISDQERAFGDYSLGRSAWILRDVRRLEKPIPAKGKLGLWEYDLQADELRK